MANFLEPDAPKILKLCNAPVKFKMKPGFAPMELTIVWSVGHHRSGNCPFKEELCFFEVDLPGHSCAQFSVVEDESDG